MRTETDMWSYRTGVGDTDLATADITGFGVEALDGGIGKIDEATHEVGASEIVVDTGPWIFGKKVILPAGVIDRIDTADEKVYVNRTKDQIKNAPELDEHGVPDDAYRDRLGSYYGPDGPGWTDYQPRV
jgi:hypothetical protein